jgi:hypothetical protein
VATQGGALAVFVPFRVLQNNPTTHFSSSFDLIWGPLIDCVQYLVAFASPWGLLSSNRGQGGEVNLKMGVRSRF